MNVNPFSYLTERIKNKVDKNEVYIDSSVDLNDCTDTYTLYYCTGASVPINAPTAGAYNFLVWNETHGNYSCQFYFSYNANKIFWRKREVNTWGSWNELALKSDLKHDDYTLNFDGNGVTYLDNSKYLFFVSEGDCLISKASSLYLRAIDTSLNPVGPKVGSVTFSAYYFS